MTNRSRSTWALAGLAGLALVVSGCGSEGLTEVSDPQVQVAVQESAQVALNALYMADGAYSLIGRLLGEVGTSAALSSAQPAVAALPTLACDASFDLGNGVTGECTLTDRTDDADDLIDTATLSFHGTMEVDGLPTSINSSTDGGSLVVTLPVDQPTSGTRCAVTFAALASNTRWTANWSFNHTADVEDIALLADLSPTLSLIITPAGGSSAAATTTLSPALRTVSYQTRSGLNVSYVVDAATWLGYVTVNGPNVATVTIENGCATFNYDSPSLVDETICRP
jgi:hypothetical protein